MELSEDMRMTAYKIPTFQLHISSELKLFLRTYPTQ